MEKVKYENIIVGAGQGGIPLALALAGLGQRTALIEEKHVGGTCINTGCTPTKTMAASAEEAFQVRRSAEYGILAGGVSADLRSIRRRKREIVERFRASGERRIGKARDLELIRGRACFTGPHSLSVMSADGERLMAAERIFIDVGGRPAVPPVSGLEAVPWLDNESIMELEQVPEHLLVLGGGYVGVEFAQMFRRFGSRVTVVQRAGQLLRREDEEISTAILEIFREEGIEVFCGAAASGVEGTPGEVRLTVEIGETRRRFEGTHLLVATGRRPNTESLDLPAAGVQVDDRGYIRVNDRLETTSAGVWALGDVKGGPEFTHISYDDYRIIYRNLFGDGRGTTNGRLVPYTVFIDPQLGRIGLTEREARQAGRPVRVARLPMRRVARASETGRTRGLMKAVVDAENDRVLGFAMLGMQGGEIAGAVQLAMMGGLPYTALRDGIFTHPTLLEALNNLFAGLE